LSHLVPTFSKIEEPVWVYTDRNFRCQHENSGLRRAP
jgi:hypothetical protein